ncbi:MAG: hypothetical protein IPO19_12980 [Rhodoferax sp.]|nr:hypothetical protein [Rhodoferax sp.]
MHIHITGASGSGCTTLAAALADDLDLLHLDADSYYWTPSAPPFQVKRNATQRLNLLSNDIASSRGVVLSGSIVGWGVEIEDLFDLIVFLYLPAPIRVERLRRRELDKYARVDQAFLEWAALYDQGPPEGRSLAKHTAWLSQRRCPVLRLEADESVSARLQQVRAALSDLRPRAV